MFGGLIGRGTDFLFLEDARDGKSSKASIFNTAVSPTKAGPERWREGDWSRGSKWAETISLLLGTKVEVVLNSRYASENTPKC